MPNWSEFFGGTPFESSDSCCYGIPRLKNTNNPSYIGECVGGECEILFNFSSITKNAEYCGFEAFRSVEAEALAQAPKYYLKATFSTSQTTDIVRSGASCYDINNNWGWTEGHYTENLERGGSGSVSYDSSDCSVSSSNMNETPIINLPIRDAVGISWWHPYVWFKLDSILHERTKTFTGACYPSINGTDTYYDFEKFRFPSEGDVEADDWIYSVNPTLFSASYDVEYDSGGSESAEGSITLSNEDTRENALARATELIQSRGYTKDTDVARRSDRFEVTTSSYTVTANVPLQCLTGGQIFRVTVIYQAAEHNGGGYSIEAYEDFGQQTIDFTRDSDTTSASYDIPTLENHTVMVKEYIAEVIQP